MDIIPLYKLATNHISSSYSSGKWIDGKYTKLLEEKLKDYLDVKHVILTNSGTSALLTAYWLINQKYQSINVDPYTFPATYQTARFLGYKTNYLRLILSSKKLPSKNLNVLVHLFGQPDDRIITSDASRIIEDACQSFGAEINGKKVGTFGIFGCLSFYPTKILHTSGHGGALIFNETSYFKKAKTFIESGRFEGQITENVGLNLRIDEIKAEFLLHELKDFDTRINTQRDIANEFIKIIPTEQPFLIEKPGQQHVYSIFNLLIQERDAFRSFMKEKGIETMVYYDENVLPKQRQKIYLDITTHIVAIPCRWNLSNQEISKIKEALNQWFIKKGF